MMQQAKERVVIIGSGNLAEALAHAVSASDASLVQIYARNSERAQSIANSTGAEWTSEPSALTQDADIYITAVSDGAISEVISALPIPADAIIAHTAGSVPLDIIPAGFARRAVFYPLQTFTKGRGVDFAQIPVFIEAGDAETLKAVESFARRLSRTVIHAGSEQRSKLHLAAVFACNFVNCMYAVGEDIVTQAGLPFDILKPLIAETAAKAIAAQSPADVQTGPAVRNDTATMQRHLSLLDDDKLKEIYKTISETIWETSKKT